MDSAAWRLLSGTVKSVYATRPEAKNETLAKKTIQMAPTYSTGVSRADFAHAQTTDLLAW